MRFLERWQSEKNDQKYQPGDREDQCDFDDREAARGVIALRGGQIVELSWLDFSIDVMATQARKSAKKSRAESCRKLAEKLQAEIREKSACKKSEIRPQKI